MRSFTEAFSECDPVARLPCCCRLVDEESNDGWTVLEGLTDGYLLCFLGMKEQGSRCTPYSYGKNGPGEDESSAMAERSHTF